MRFTKKFLWAAFFLLPVLFLNSDAAGAVMDDYTPDVTARVARISFIRGDVQIRRGGETEDWERAALNLPLVEGDEISTGGGAYLEIQFDSSSHLRLSENSYLKFTTLRDDGVAVSLPQGTLNLRLLNFEKERAFFEIDAPGTTISVEKAGMFRVDAGDGRSSEIRLRATEQGEARVYTETSGFTLRSGRAARIFIEGSYAGDYETSDVARLPDEFDEWVLQRDAVVAKRLRDSYYDKYYDREMYGAEDLSEYGEWIYTKKYGYVWKPYPGSIRGYSDWSPYRYGHWRWIPVYGWTWVNDEPWGWATYHHGRWVWDDGYWVWTPYAYHRWRRSWWRPAMVTITTWNGSMICWYPLPYDVPYYDYNSYYYRRGNTRIYNNTTIINNRTIIVNPTPNPTPNASPTPPVVVQNPTNTDRRQRLQTPSLQRVPPGAVVAVDTSEFGRQTKGYRKVPLETAKKVLTADDTQSPPILPTYPDLNRKISTEILIENPRRVNENASVKVGASERRDNAPLDEQLRKKLILGNRTPVLPGETRNDRDENANRSNKSAPRPTGSVSRPVFKRDEDDSNKTETPPIIAPRSDFPKRDTGGGKTDDGDDERRRERRPTYRPKQSDETQTPPIFVPPPKQKEERREQPNFPPRQESPKQREEPRREEPRREPPPPKSEPKPNPPPQPERKSPPIVERKTEKDN